MAASNRPPLSPLPSPAPAPGLTPPIAPRHDHVVTMHGETRVDPYHWLRAENWQAVMEDPSLLDAEIRAHLEAENAYTEAVLAPTRELQERLVAEMRGRIKEDDWSVPQPDGAYAYYRRFNAGGQYPSFCRIPRDGTPGDRHETVLLDGDREAAGQAFYRLGAVEHSPDHRLLATAVDLNGSEYYTIRIREIASGASFPDLIARSAGDIAWAADSETFFYTVLDDHHRPLEVRRHHVGDDPDNDPVVYREADPGFYVHVGLTESERFIVVAASDHQTSEIRVIPANDPTAAPRLLVPRRQGVEYHPSDHGDRWLIHTNDGEAEDFKIVTAPLDQAQPERWTDLVPHRPGALIRSMLVFPDHVVRLEMQDALPRIVVHDFATGAEHTITMDADAYDLDLAPGYEYRTTLRYVYSSHTTPARVYDYDLPGRARTLRKEQEVPSGHDPACYVTHRLHATSPDGAAIPVTILHHRDTPIDGSAPLLLEGYGAYGISLEADFTTNRLSLVDRGFVFAIAHVRGGKEGGYRWYREGKLAHKPNTFHDFIAAARALIAEGYTTAGQIVATGGSAGGMLMGAVANMAPELFRGIVAQVPFVDVLNTMCDATLPLTPPEWLEWGDPITSAKDYARIQAYSPYDNVRAQAYPHILATGGLSDPRVTYWEPAKWVARLRAAQSGAAQTNDALILLHLNLEAGHGGASGRFERLEEIARNFAFALLISARTETPLLPTQRPAGAV